jgi:hypothetical protein
MTSLQSKSELLARKLKPGQAEDVQRFGVSTVARTDV